MDWWKIALITFVAAGMRELYQFVTGRDLFPANPRGPLYRWFGPKEPQPPLPPLTGYRKAFHYAFHGFLIAILMTLPISLIWMYGGYQGWWPRLI